MRSPFNTPQNQLSHPKTTTTYPHPNNNITITNYEPTSVLDLRRSPSPVHGGGSDSVNNFTAISGVSDDSPLPWDEHPHAVLPAPHLLSPEDWDSMILGLPEKDDLPLPPNRNLESSDPSPFLLNDFIQNPGFNDFHNNQLQLTSSESNSEFNCSQLDELIRAAVLVESNDSASAQVILARLNQLSPVGKPLQRSAFYFKEALVFLLSGSSLCFAGGGVSPLEIVHKIKAYKAFSELSPITMFANFTANQTLLEALDGAVFIHIIDFEIGIGGQWASFMQEIACKAKSRNVIPSSLRITAVISPESSMEAALIRDNLQHFAQQLGIQFQLDFILFDTFQDLLFNAITFINGESIAINLSPKIFRHLRTPESIAQFLRFLRRISPRVTVFVDFEGSLDSTFRRNFVNGLEFYSSLFESLDVASGGDEELVRRIERFLIRPKIFAGVTAAAANSSLPWRELFSSVGMLPVQFSGFTESQAEWLVRRAQLRGFHVAKRHGSMLLCWHGKELVATSAWRC